MRPDNEQPRDRLATGAGPRDEIAAGGFVASTVTPATDSTLNDWTAEQGRAFVEQARAVCRSIEQMRRDTIAAVRGRIWIALGYASWNEFLAREFDGPMVAVSGAGRSEFVTALREAGVPTRAIAGVLGVSEGTVRNSTAQNYAVPEKVSSLDGRQRPARGQTRTQRTREPDPECLETHSPARYAATLLSRAAEPMTVEEIAADYRHFLGGDLSRLRTRGLTDRQAAQYLIGRGLDLIADYIAVEDGCYRLTRPFAEVRICGSEIAPYDVEYDDPEGEEWYLRAFCLEPHEVEARDAQRRRETYDRGVERGVRLVNAALYAMADRRWTPNTMTSMLLHFIAQRVLAAEVAVPPEALSKVRDGSFTAEAESYLRRVETEK